MSPAWSERIKSEENGGVIILLFCIDLSEIDVFIGSLQHVLLHDTLYLQRRATLLCE